MSFFFFFFSFKMAQVPLRMAQPGLVPPHQQRPPMMVSMTQPPPVSMQGLFIKVKKLIIDAIETL